jgi:hypothetical protein
MRSGDTDPPSPRPRDPARTENVLPKKGATPVTSETMPSRWPLSPLTKVTIGALFVNALAYASELIRLGPLDPEVGIVVICLLVVSALVALGWRWTPSLGGLLAGAILLGNPFLLTNLSDPGANLFFVATVAEVVSGLTALLAGVAATVQSYRAQATRPDA